MENTMENTEEKRIIEINGTKIEVDLRTAKRIDSFKVGDNVKILIEEYNNKLTPHLGVIIGFDNFQKNPTIIVAYLDISYSSAVIRYAYINSGSSKVELCPINDWDIPYTKSDIITMLDGEINKAKEALRDLETKKNVFLSTFGKYFEKNSF